MSVILYMMMSSLHLLNTVRHIHKYYYHCLVPHVTTLLSFHSVRQREDWLTLKTQCLHASKVDTVCQQQVLLRPKTEISKTEQSNTLSHMYEVTNQYSTDIRQSQNSFVKINSGLNQWHPSFM